MIQKGTDIFARESTVRESVIVWTRNSRFSYLRHRPQGRISTQFRRAWLEGFPGAASNAASGNF
jgi:hypothetical protein